MSVQAQCHAAMPHPLTKRALYLATSRASLDELADHIAEFSLAGVQQVHATQKVNAVEKVHRVHRG